MSSGYIPRHRRPPRVRRSALLTIGALALAGIAALIGLRLTHPSSDTATPRDALSPSPLAPAVTAADQRPLPPLPAAPHESEVPVTAGGTPSAPVTVGAAPLAPG